MNLQFYGLFRVACWVIQNALGESTVLWLIQSRMRLDRMQCARNQRTASHDENDQSIITDYTLDACLVSIKETSLCFVVIIVVVVLLPFTPVYLYTLTFGVLKFNLNCLLVPL